MIMVIHSFGLLVGYKLLSQLTPDYLLIYTESDIRQQTIRQMASVMIYIRSDTAHQSDQLRVSR